MDRKLFLAYIGDLKPNYSPASVNFRIRYLKVYLKWLLQEGYTTENYYIRLKLLRVPKDSVQPLSVHEVKKIFKKMNLSDFSDFRDYVAMLLMLDTGIRANETCSILLTDIDIKKRIIRVRGQIAKNRHETIAGFLKNYQTY